MLAARRGRRALAPRPGPVSRGRPGPGGRRGCGRWRWRSL